MLIKATSQEASKKVLSSAETWVDKHGDILFRFALARLRNPSLAEEVVQETFLSAVKAKDSFQGRSPEQSWLIGILKNKIMEHFRRSSREKTIDLDANFGGEDFDAGGHWRVFEGRGPIDWESTPSKLLQQSEFMETLQNCLSKMPSKFSDVFRMKEMDDVDSDEVCKVFKISPSNLWVIMHRSRMMLRNCLEINWFGSRVSEEAKGPVMKKC